MSLAVPAQPQREEGLPDDHEIVPLGPGADPGAVLVDFRDLGHPSVGEASRSEQRQHARGARVRPSERVAVRPRQPDRECAVEQPVDGVVIDAFVALSIR